MRSLLLIAPLLLGAAQSTGKVSPTGDVSASRVTATGSTTARAEKDRWADVVNVKDFGAVGDGVADDTAAIQAAITATPYGGTCFLPKGTYRLEGTGTTLLTIPRVMRFGGASMLGATLSVGPTVPNTTDVLTMSAGAGNHQGLRLENFSILPASGAPGRNGIVFDVETAGWAWSRVLIDHVFVRARAGRAVYVKNPNLDHDAFYTSTIRDSHLEGGVYLLGGGDSINILANTLTTASSALAAGLGAGVEAVLLSDADAGLGDAKMLVIEGNNITASGGAVWVRAGTQPKILHNNIELYYGPTAQTNKALIDIDGDATHIIEAPEIVGNHFGPTTHSVNWMVRLNYARRGAVRDNTFAPSSGWGSGGEAYPTPSTPAAGTANVTPGVWFFSVVGTGSQDVSAGTATATNYGTATAGAGKTITVTVGGTVTLSAVTGSLTSASLAGPYDVTWGGLRIESNAMDIDVGPQNWPYPDWYNNEGRMVSNPNGVAVKTWQMTGRKEPIFGATVSGIAPWVADTYVINATSGIGFTVSNPDTAGAHYPRANGHTLTIRINNASGGALGAVTWGSQYKLGAWTAPANGYGRSITFAWDGTNWVEQTRTSVDVPN
jgi:hypothetical protein